MSDSTSAGSSSPITELGAGVTFQWLHDGKIIAITSENSSRVAIDAWADKLIEVIHSWPVDQSMLVLADISRGKNAQTPYLRARSQELMEVRPEVTLVTAMVMPHSILAQLMQIALRTSHGSNVKMQLFFDRERALRWLMEYVPTGNTSA